MREIVRTLKQGPRHVACGAHFRCGAVYVLALGCQNSKLCGQYKLSTYRVMRLGPCACAMIVIGKWGLSVQVQVVRIFTDMSVYRVSLRDSAPIVTPFVRVRSKEFSLP